MDWSFCRGGTAAPLVYHDPNSRDRTDGKPARRRTWFDRSGQRIKGLKPQDKEGTVEGLEPEWRLSYGGGMEGCSMAKETVVSLWVDDSTLDLLGRCRELGHFAATTDTLIA